MAKPPYWLDANIFIEANNTFFNMDIVPSFWIWLEDKLKAGVLISSSLVYAEIVGKDDALKKWASVRKRRILARTRPRRTGRLSRNRRVC
jgi:hypothetical protein